MPIQCQLILHSPLNQLLREFAKPMRSRSNQFSLRTLIRYLLILHSPLNQLQQEFAKPMRSRSNQFSLRMLIQCRLILHNRSNPLHQEFALPKLQERHLHQRFSHIRSNQQILAVLRPKRNFQMFPLLNSFQKLLFLLQNPLHLELLEVQILMHSLLNQLLREFVKPMRSRSNQFSLRMLIQCRLILHNPSNPLHLEFAKPMRSRPNLFS